MISEHKLVKLIESFENRIYELSVYWLTLSTDRNDYAEKIKCIRGNSGIVPWVVRSQGLFSDPNAIMNDVAQILEEAREEIESLWKSNCSLRRIDIVLLSRKSLDIAATSSPITLPYWFPMASGQTVTAQIVDLTWNLNVPISDESVEVSELQRLLYELDILMLERIEASFVENRNAVQAFCNYVNVDKQNPLSTFQDFKINLQKIENPAKYRPSRRNATIIGNLWELANSKTNDQQYRIAKAMSKALSLNKLCEQNHIPLVAALSRSGSKTTDQQILWSLSLLHAIRSSCQFVTAAAHADEYPSYPITLLKSYSLDLRAHLNSAIQILEKSD